MLWSDLSDDAALVLGWTEHFYTGQKQVLTIEKGTNFVQQLDDKDDIVIPITYILFEEIKNYLPHDILGDFKFTITDNVIIVTLKDGVKLH